MSVNEIRDFIFEKYYIKIAFSEENNYHSMKCLKKKSFCLLLFYLFIVACKQINRRKDLIFAMRRNTITRL